MEDDREVADIMIQEVERLNRAVTQLLEFAKPVPVMAKKVNIRELISHSIKLIEHDLTQKGIAVKVVCSLKRENEDIVTDPDRLNQILLNLYLNAMQAMDENGKLVVRVSELDRVSETKSEKKFNGYEADVEKKVKNYEADGEKKIKNYDADGEKKIKHYDTDFKHRILLEVTDTGKGIEEKDIDHIFDPYFTNRPGGSGLGLAMVHSAIEALGADIHVKSEWGKGTSFFIRLPCLINLETTNENNK
ncbi:MAG: hypothetical protein HQK67_01380 [Desulfamplus sp.]|nr:hypothetical protein [Desulfamplus sp.]